MKRSTLKKVLCLVLALCLTAALAACGGGVQKNGDENQTTFTIMGGMSSLSSGYDSNPVMQQMAENAGIEIEWDLMADSLSERVGVTIGGILIGRRRFCGDVEVDDRLARFGVAAEKLFVIADARRRRLGQLSRALHVGKDILRDDIHAVVEGILPEDDGERHDADIALHPVDAEVASAVCGKLDLIHMFPPDR